MKKLSFYTVILCIVALLSACNKLTQYTITEQEINQYLQKHTKYEKQIGIGIADANIVLGNLNAQIGRSEPNIVTLSAEAKVDVKSIIGGQSANLKLSLKAQPVFEKETSSVYLKEMELTDYTVQPEKLNTMMATLIPYLNQSLKSYFNENPAYRLADDRTKAEALAKKLAKGIEVKPGEIIIPFTE